jgi:cobalt-zinc-cadmium efflux system membrane fusion protein
MKRVELSWPLLAVAAAMLVTVGAGGAYVWLSSQGNAIPAAASGRLAPPSAPESGPLPDVVITLSEDAANKAGIAASPVTLSKSTGSIRLSGVVAPNAYGEVIVTPLAGGRVTRVAVSLGERVARNAPLVEIYSPDLAETQARYLSARAEFDAVDREIARTTRLAEIGAASQQELERLHADHVRHRTEVESARTRLQLLGMTSQQIQALAATGEVVASTTVVSPIAGVVTARAVNPGTNVDAATPLVTVVDLSTVWIVGDLYERDFSRVLVGTPATVTTTAFPDDRIAGKVAYIDPQLKAETRTAQIRVEVPNTGQRLRLGMSAEVHVETAGAKRKSVAIPRSAVQNIGDRTVVYLADPRAGGRFTEREVRLGSATGEQVEIVAGIQPGDLVVTSGSFALRAERERLGLKPATHP